MIFPSIIFHDDPFDAASIIYQLIALFKGYKTLLYSSLKIDGHYAEKYDIMLKKHKIWPTSSIVYTISRQQQNTCFWFFKV
jgi:hypothetical protein